MSELTPTPEELVEEIGFTIDQSNTVPYPIDPTLSIQGEAADAKATGDAIAGVFGGAKVNDKTFVDKAVTLYGTDIKMSSAEGAQTIPEAFEAITDRDASEIMYDADNLVTIGDALDDIYVQIDSELSETEIDELFAEVFGGDE